LVSGLHAASAIDATINNPTPNRGPKRTNLTPGISSGRELCYE
jgi:hypothetical protein